MVSAPEVRITTANRRKSRLPQTAMLVLLTLSSIGRSAQADAFLFGGSAGTAAQLQLNTSSGPVTLDTSASEFTPGTLNQGWWSTNDGNSNSNDSYIVGTLTVGATNFQFNNYFTFFLPEGTGTVLSADLLLQQFGGTGPPNLTYNLWDVSTSADVLNDKVNNPDAAIYHDLGSGTSYGSLAVSTTGNPLNVLDFSLNANALANLNAHSIDGGFFSIGGSLNLTPEPSSVVLAGLGAVGLFIAARRRRKA